MGSLGSLWRHGVSVSWEIREDAPLFAREAEGP